MDDRAVEIFRMRKIPEDPKRSVIVEKLASPGGQDGQKEGIGKERDFVPFLGDTRLLRFSSTSSSSQEEDVEDRRNSEKVFGSRAGWMILAHAAQIIAWKL